MPENHIIPVAYAADGYTRTRPAYQYDYGQVLKLQDFPELPIGFEMHFSIGNGEAIARIGENGDVAIPNVCLERFGTLAAWLFLHDDVTDGETRYTIEIPVRGRAKATDQEPTPEEQSEITEAIAALQAGVRAAEAAQTAAETAQGKAETAQGKAEDAEDGAEDVLDAMTDLAADTLADMAGYTNTASIKARDAADSAAAAQEAARSVMNASAEATTLEPGSAATADVQNRDGVITFLLGIPEGDPGDPTELIDDTAGDGDTDKTWSADKITDELSNIKTMNIHICGSGEYDSQTGVPTVQNPDEKTFYLVPGGTSPNLYVEWIYTNNAWEQVGSATIDLSNYVQKTDYATVDDGGVVKIVANGNGGISLNSANKLIISGAALTLIKPGENNYRPIVPSHQHEATFYGLAKAAGDDTQAVSSNPVGTYTDDAKTAIKTMLGVSGGGGGAEIDDTAGAGDVTKAWSADKLTTEFGNVNGALNALPTDETAQEILADEESNAGLTEIALNVIGMLFDNLPQDEILTDILHSLELECERLNTIYNGWIAERESA